ncbi:uncharacterized protein LOC113305327 [Papaver somniferum]|uniref:uncharacterized protein LOC113305327 n=1 Tax=Papaver somniferum TaxID=3469 RepID=UPI000E6FEA97|nr:uncharacterized protein LOC113305327 [Papaver somniferum]
MKIRQSINQISELEDTNGNIIMDQEKISAELVKYFENRFQYKEVNIVKSLLDIVPNLIISEGQDMLDATPTTEEIKAIVFSIDANSSLGPGAKTAAHFRPIGLSNVSFKIITKLITLRMSTLMNNLVSPQQTAYIKGRNIQEQVLLASEMVNEMKKKRRGNVELKLDISQGYDAVSWEFFMQVLLKYWFSLNGY